MSKALVIGDNYGECFGVTKEYGTMTYNGGDIWTLTNAKGEVQTVEDATLTAGATEYVNRPSVTMGHL